MTGVQSLNMIVYGVLLHVLDVRLVIHPSNEDTILEDLRDGNVMIMQRSEEALHTILGMILCYVKVILRNRSR